MSNFDVAAPVPSTSALVSRSRPGRGRSWLLAAGDLAALATASIIASAVTATIAPITRDAPAWLVLVLIVGVVPYWIGIFAAYGLYDNDLRRVAMTSIDEAGAIFHALLVGSLGLLMADQLLRRVSDWRLSSAVESVAFVAIALLAVIVARGTLRSWIFTRIFRRKRALLVGDGDDARFFEHALDGNPEFGIDIVGVLSDADGGSPEGAPVVGRRADVARVVNAMGVDRVVLTSDADATEETLDLLRSVRRPDVQVSILPRYYEVFTSHATLEDVAGAPIVTLPSTRLRRSAWLVKRTVDVVASGTLLVLLSPALLVIAAAIKLDSPGPVLYRQPRRGRGGSIFSIAKFRTMFVDSEQRRADVLHLNEVDGPLFKIKGRDPRVTRVGALLRGWSLDELPQLWNVLRGDMSLVGPRPFVVYEADQITGWAGRRLDITPGITGPWQVLGRNDLSFAEMVRLDYLYATNWSLWWDLRLLYQTVLVVLKRRGAY